MSKLSYKEHYSLIKELSDKKVRNRDIAKQVGVSERTVSKFKKDHGLTQKYVKWDVDKVKEYIGKDGYKLISTEFTKCADKLEMECPNGHRFWMSLNHFQQGNRCLECQGIIPWDYTRVKEYVESIGYTLLSDKYIDNSTKLKLICDNGHFCNMTLAAVRNGARCSQCNGGVRLEYNDVKSYLEEYGYKLLSDTYINAKTPLKMECPNGHALTMRFSNFKTGARCLECRNIISWDLEKVDEYIGSFGYKLLSNKYQNNLTPLLLRCPEGHEFETNLNNFKSGARCPICNGGVRYSYEFVKETVEKEGYTLLSDEYINGTTPLEMICPEGHHIFMRFQTFIRGNRCIVCGGKQKYTYEKVKNDIESRGYKLLSKEYINAKTKMKVMCPKGHIYETTYTNLCVSNSGCPICLKYSFISKGEREVGDFVKKIVDCSVERVNRGAIISEKTGRALELDVWVPDINVAVEFDGTYWHSFDHIKEKDKYKDELCSKKGIRLYHVKEYDWTNDPEYVAYDLYKFIHGDAPEFDKFINTYFN